MPRRRRSVKPLEEVVERYSRGWWFHWLFKKPKLPELKVAEEGEEK